MRNWGRYHYARKGWKHWWTPLSHQQVPPTVGPIRCTAGHNVERSAHGPEDSSMRPQRSHRKGRVHPSGSSGDSLV